MDSEELVILHTVGSSSNMVVPTLPVVGVVPPSMLFHILEMPAITLAYVLLGAAFMSTLVLVKPLLMPLLYCVKPSSKTPEQHGLGGCRRCMNTVFLFVGRLLCVHTFPALFKMHKTRSGHGSQTIAKPIYADLSDIVSQYISQKGTASHTLC